MALTVDDVKNAVKSDASDDALVQSCFTAADELLEQYVEDQITDEGIPEAVMDRAHLLVAVEMFNQTKAPNGVLNQTYDFGEGDITSTPIRISADPLRPAYAVLSRWMPGATIG